MTRLLVAALAALVLAPLAHGATPLRVRPAVPADDASKPGATEWWHLLAFDPGSRTYVRVIFMARPWVDFRLEVIRGGAATIGIAGGAMAITPQSSPGVTMVGTSPPPGATPPRASLAYAGGRYVVDASSGANGAHLEIVPRRAGVTVGRGASGRCRRRGTRPRSCPGLARGACRSRPAPRAAGSWSTAGGWR